MQDPRRKEPLLETPRTLEKRVARIQILICSSNTLHHRRCKELDVTIGMAKHQWNFRPAGFNSLEMLRLMFTGGAWTEQDSGGCVGRDGDVGV